MFTFVSFLCATRVLSRDRKLQVLGADRAGTVRCVVGSFVHPGAAVSGESAFAIHGDALDYDYGINKALKRRCDLAILLTQNTAQTELRENSQGTRLEDLEQRQASRLATTADTRDKLAALATPDLAQLAAEDLRQLISQGLALDQLVPHALSILLQSPMMRADLFPGDLFEALKTVPFDFWDQRPDLRLAWNRLRSLHESDDE